MSLEPGRYWFAARDDFLRISDLHDLSRVADSLGIPRGAVITSVDIKDDAFDRPGFVIHYVQVKEDD